MRGFAGAWALAAALVAQGQAGWMPLSREVERPFAAALQAVGSPAHTAIRPYRLTDLRQADPQDSLRPAAWLPALDRWSGARNGRRFRWGPLLDLSGNLGLDSASVIGHRAGAGFWMEQDIGARLTLHADAQGWSERLPGYLDTLARATQVTSGEGYAFSDGAGFAHYDWNAQVSWDPGKYFNLTLGRGKNAFGEGHRSLFLSSEATSYPFLRITTTAWRFKYVNLFTVMNDIRGAGGVSSRFERKYASMHYLSVNAHRRINLALFEAIVWSRGDSLYPRGFDVNYLNPVIFYRPVEYSVGSPDNALLGFAVNIKVGRSGLLYSQLMLDEFLLREVRAGDGWYANKQAVQLGFVAREAFRVPGLMLRAEWNMVRPFMYTHSDTRQNYAHMGQPLTHPYGSNFQEAIAQGEWSRERWLLGVRASMAWLGRDTLESFGNSIFRPETERPTVASGAFRSYGYRIGMLEEYSLFHGELRAGWLVDPASATRLEVSWLARGSMPASGPGEWTQVFRVGLVCHFRDRHPEQEVRYVLQ